MGFNKEKLDELLAPHTEELSLGEQKLSPEAVKLLLEGIDNGMPSRLREAIVLSKLKSTRVLNVSVIPPPGSAKPHSITLTPTEHICRLDWLAGFESASEFGNSILGYLGRHFWCDMFSAGLGMLMGRAGPLEPAVLSNVCKQAEAWEAEGSIAVLSLGKSGGLYGDLATLVSDPKGARVLLTSPLKELYLSVSDHILVRTSAEETPRGDRVTLKCHLWFDMAISPGARANFYEIVES